uniref:Uncharacterized protein n=1 Tax=Tetranychus urticae TaxID=32264 RepID=T1KJL4_TETUR
MLFLSSIQLIYSIAHEDGEQIGWTVINLLADLCFVIVILKQWELGLKIYRVAMQAFVVLSIIALIFCIYIIASGDERHKQDIAEKTVSVIIGAVLYSMLAYLLNRYLHQIEYNEGYTIA